MKKSGKPYAAAEFSPRMQSLLQQPQSFNLDLIEHVWTTMRWRFNRKLEKFPTLENLKEIGQLNQEVSLVTNFSNL